MKNFQDLLNDLRDNEALHKEASQINGKDYAAIVVFGKAHGYDSAEEDIYFHRAADREPDDMKCKWSAAVWRVRRITSASSEISAGAMPAITTPQADASDRKPAWRCYRNKTIQK